MPHLPHSIELHDSRLASVKSEGGVITIALRPAYIHQDGKGWTQHANIVFSEASCGQDPQELPARISDGMLKSAAGPYHNLLTLPLNDAGPVTFTLELETDEVVHVHSKSVQILLLGEPIFVEDVT